MRNLQLHLLQRKAMFRGPVKLDRNEVIPQSIRARTITQFARMANMWGVEEDCYEAHDYCLANLVYKHTKRFVWPGATGNLPMALYEHHRDELLERLRNEGNMQLATKAELLWEGLRLADEDRVSEQLAALVHHLADSIFAPDEAPASRPASADQMAVVLQDEIVARERFRVRPKEPAKPVQDIQRGRFIRASG